MSETELRACPHCASADVSLSYSVGMHDTTPKSRFVECEKCGAMGPVAETEEEACRLWNSRPDSSGRLREALTDLRDWMMAVAESDHPLIEKADAALAIAEAGINRDVTNG